MLNITITPRQLSTTAALQVELNSLKQILEVHADIFQPGLGTCTRDSHFAMKQCLITVNLTDFHLLSNLLFELNYIDQLEKNGVIEKMIQSDYATPIVVVKKSGGRVHICGNFKVILNPVLRNDALSSTATTSTLPKLNGRVHFSKLDLADACLQIEPDNAWL